MRFPVKPYTGPFPYDERRRRKFLLFPRIIGNERVWWEWVWKVDVYAYIPGRDFALYAWRFERYELIP